MKNKLRIGITGGIGTGKSTVCKILETMGFPVYYSDAEAKRLMHEHKELILEITATFGDAAYLNGELQNKTLANVIFNQPEKRELLNSLVHPKVREDFKEWSGRQQSDLIFQESAILFETGGYKFFDHVVLVTAPKDVRISRIQKRDNATTEQVEARIANQLPEEEKINMAEFVICNDGDKLVIPAVIDIISKIRSSTV